MDEWEVQMFFSGTHIVIRKRIDELTIRISEIPQEGVE